MLEIYDTGKKPFISPKGIAKFPALLNADDHYDKPHGIYKVDLIVTPTQAKAVAAHAKREAVKFKNEDLKSNPSRKDWGIHVPVTPDLNKEKEETGQMILRFKQKKMIVTRDGREIEKKIFICDADGNRTTNIEPKGGSKLNVAYYMLAYMAPSTKTYGVTFRLLGVQIIELVESSERDMGFTKQEGYVQPKQEAVDNEEEIQIEDFQTGSTVSMESDEEDTEAPSF